MRPLRIGVNALYLIPGGVGGTEIYLHELLRALAEIDARNEYFVFTNRETGPDLVPQQPNFHGMPQRVRARFRPARIVWEQTVLPLAAARLGHPNRNTVIEAFAYFESTGFLLFLRLITPKGAN